MYVKQNEASNSQRKHSFIFFVFAVITIFIGVKIGEDRKKIVHSAVFFMLIGFAAFHCVIEIILTAHKFVGDMAAKGMLPSARN
jgi:hypothetical protein